MEKIYELCKKTSRIMKPELYVPKVTRDADDSIISRFDTLNGALEALKRCKTEIKAADEGFMVTEYLVNDISIGENGEMSSYTEIWLHEIE